MIILSLIIPVYNVEKYIKSCLDSIFSQDTDLDMYEVIIVNDGTPDNSMVIVDEFANKYNNITIINQENQGLSAARNAGITIARGEYIWFIDSDDTISPNILNALISGFLQKDVDIVGMDITQISESTGDQKTQLTSIDSKHINSMLSGAEFSECKMHFAPIQRFVFKRAFLMKYNLLFMRDIYHEDVEFACRALYLADNVYISNTIGYEYLMRTAGSIMASYKIKRSYDLMKIATSLKNFRDENITSKREINIFNRKILFCYIHAIVMARGNTENIEFENFLKEHREHLKEGLIYSFSLTPFSLKKIIEGFLLRFKPLWLISYNEWKNNLK